MEFHDRGRRKRLRLIVASLLALVLLTACTAPSAPVAQEQVVQAPDVQTPQQEAAPIRTELTEKVSAANEQTVLQRAEATASLNTYILFGAEY
jgi:hypothetical protein